MPADKAIRNLTGTYLPDSASAPDFFFLAARVTLGAA